jgi:hypothetical protein
MRVIVLLCAGLVVGAAPAGAAAAANGRIAFATEDGLASMNPDGSGRWGLRSTRNGQGEPAWAPDGSAIALTETNASGTALATMNPDGTNVRLLSGRTFANSPSWSPDGAELAFDDGTDLYVTTLEGKATRLVRGLAPSWSPDGKSIAFVDFTVDGRFDVFVLERSSGRVARLTSGPAIDVAPAWSPNGDRVAFVSDRTGGRAVYTMSPDGTGQTRLTQGPADTQPAWSPDGTRIAFVRDDQIWVSASDGTNARQLTRGTAAAESPAWQPLGAAPEGCTLWGTHAADLLVGTPSGDVVCGLEGDDWLIGLAGRDELRGGGGTDRLAGGTGCDRLRGGDGDDAIDARDGGADALFGDAGADTAQVDSRALDSRVGVERFAVSRNVAAWRPTRASNEVPTNPSALVADGVLDDFWSSGRSPPQWVEVDLLRPTTVARLRLYASDLPAGAIVDVFGRRPGARARLLDRFTGPLDFKQPISFRPKRARRGIRYVRLQVSSASDALRAVTWPELEVYAP